MSSKASAQSFDLGRQQIDLQIMSQSQLRVRDTMFDMDVQRRYAQQMMRDLSHRVREQSQNARFKANELKDQVRKAQLIAPAPMIESAQRDNLNRQAPIAQINIRDAQQRLAMAQANLDEARRQANQNMKDMVERARTQRQIQRDFFRSMR